MGQDVLIVKASTACETLNHKVVKHFEDESGRLAHRAVARMDRALKALQDRALSAFHRLVYDLYRVSYKLTVAVPAEKVHVEILDSRGNQPEDVEAVLVLFNWSKLLCYLDGLH
jgi:hypothetical protein